MKKSILALALGSLMTGTAFAEAYVGAGIGQGHIELNCTSASSGCNSYDTGFKLNGGYMVTPSIAVELDYIRFGHARAVVGGVNIEFTSSALGAGAAYFHHFTPKWSGMARLGVATVRMKGDTAVPGLADSQASTNLFGGAGLAYELSKGLSITADIDLSRGKIDAEMGDLRLFSVGLRKSF